MNCLKRYMIVTMGTGAIVGAIAGFQEKTCLTLGQTVVESKVGKVVGTTVIGAVTYPFFIACLPFFPVQVYNAATGNPYEINFSFLHIKSD